MNSPAVIEVDPEKFDPEEFVRRLILLAPQMVATDAQLYSSHYYDQAYGLFDHDTDPNKDHSLALIMMHPGEKTNGLLFERIERFEELQIHQKFGVSLDRFLQYPREVCDFIEALAEKRQAATNRALSAAIQDQESLLKEGKP